MFRTLGKLAAILLGLFCIIGILHVLLAFFTTQMRETSGAEGYVHVHTGIHGIADLTPATHDWNNPAAHITIQRVD